jgi:lipopolysaccharide/colanic/teichoic acid biosynthesis glycosyltransferase
MIRQQRGDQSHSEDVARPIRYANGAPKRGFDVVTGTILSVVTAPVIAVFAVGSALSFRAWPLFTQQRLGLDGRPFSFIKLRSLPRDTPASADKYEISFVETSRWGRFIRATHLDELPQLWLVVAGRMSLVGPRPEMPELAATFEAAFVKERMMVRPGITGTWQVSEGSLGLIGESPEFDRMYLDHASAKLDAWILVRTLARMLGRRPLTADQFPAWIREPGEADIVAVRMVEEPAPVPPARGGLDPAT